MAETTAAPGQYSSALGSPQDILQQSDISVGVVRAFQGMSMYPNATANPPSGHTAPLPRQCEGAGSKSWGNQPRKSPARWSYTRVAKMFFHGGDRLGPAPTPMQSATEGHHYQHREVDTYSTQDLRRTSSRSVPQRLPSCYAPLTCSNDLDGFVGLIKHRDRGTDRDQVESCWDGSGCQASTQPSRSKRRSRSARSRGEAERRKGPADFIQGLPMLLSQRLPTLTPWDVAICREPFRTLTILRTIRKDDVDQVKRLHSLLFPVNYKEEFYERLLAQNVFTVLAFGPSSPVRRSCSRSSTGKEPTKLRLIGIATGRVTFPDGEQVTNLMYPPLLGVHIGPVDAICGQTGRFPHRITPHAVYAGQRRAALKARSRNETATGYIMTLGTVPEWRKIGLGSILLQVLMDFFIHHAFVDRIELDVLTSNDGAVDFYIKHGFTISAKKKAYYVIDGQPCDSYQMVYELHGTTQSPSSARSGHQQNCNYQHRQRNRQHYPHQPNTSVQQRRGCEGDNQQREPHQQLRRFWRGPRSVKDSGHNSPRGVSAT